MPEPFSIAMGVIGIVSFGIKLIEMIDQIRRDYQAVPQDVKDFDLELRSLLVLLIEIQKVLIHDQAFREALGSDVSALWSQLRAENTSKPQIKETFDTCTTELRDAIERLKRMEAGHKRAWERFRAAVQMKGVSKVVSKLHRICQIIQNLVGVHTAALTAKTYLETKEARKENQEWHSREQNRQILEWLSRLDFKEKHCDLRNRRHHGTGEWFLNEQKFKSWKDRLPDHPSTLWCTGIRESPHHKVIHFDD